MNVLPFFITIISRVRPSFLLQAGKDSTVEILKKAGAQTSNVNQTGQTPFLFYLRESRLSQLCNGIQKITNIYTDVNYIGKSQISYVGNQNL